MAKRNWSKVFEWRNRVIDKDESQPHALSSQARLVALVLSQWFDEDCRAFPSQATIGRCAGLSPRMVGRHLGELREAGWVEVTTTATAGGKRNTYRGRIPEPL